MNFRTSGRASGLLACVWAIGLFACAHGAQPAEAAAVSRTTIMTAFAPDTVVRLLDRAAEAPDGLLARARERLAAGSREDREAARQIFLAAIQLQPADPRGYVGVSDTYFRGLRHAEMPPEWSASAIAFAQKAVSRAPESAEAHFALAIAYFRQFWFRLALEHLHRAWELDPQARFAYWLGWMYSEVGELHEILPWLERARTLEPELPGLQAELGYAHRVLQNQPTAEQWLRQAVTVDDDDDYAHANLLLLYLMQGRDGEALAHAAALVERHPESARVLGSAGLAFWYAGQRERARELLESAAAIDPQVWIGTWGTIVTQPLGEIYWREGRRQEARAAFANAVAGYRQRFERASEGWGYRYDLAGIAAVQGEHEEAYAWLHDAIQFGWTDYALARRDPALRSLHPEERFRAMLRTVESRVAAMRQQLPESAPARE
jgi:tetratricopeptide (TPR) repeat protein